MDKKVYEDLLYVELPNLVNRILKEKSKPPGYSTAFNKTVSEISIQDCKPAVERRANMLTPEDIPNLTLIDTEEIANRLHCTKVRVGWYRQAGLLRYRRYGSQCLSTEEEYAEFIRLTADCDLGSKEKIRILGIQLKKAPSSKTRALK